MTAESSDCREKNHVPTVLIKTSNHFLNVPGCKQTLLIRKMEITIHMYAYAKARFIKSSHFRLDLLQLFMLQS